MSKLLVVQIVGRSHRTAVLIVMVLASAGTVRGSEPLSVRSEMAAGPYYVGQGFELRIGVVATGERPKIDPPRIAGGRTWLIGTETRPITASTIGSVAAHENLFVTRFRIVPERAGTLEIPAVPVQLKHRSGRSQPRSVLIQTVPLLGRPSEFLGGIGRFELHAEVSPQVVRVGQELEFRIKVTGPAAWGMADRPDMRRYARLPVGLRIEAKPDETINEPPARTFVFRLRPTHAGEAVLPPVAIAAYDPARARYVPQVTTGLPIRVVAVPSFDPATVSVTLPGRAISRPALITGIIISLATISSAAFVVSSMVRRRLARPWPCGPELARRFAKQTARYLGSLAVEGSDAPAYQEGRGELPNFDGPEFDGSLFHPSKWYPTSKPMILRASSPEILPSAARRIYERLASYLLVGTGQSQRVLTPDEARQGVAELTSSEELIAQAGKLAARCDLILYGSLADDPAKTLSELLVDARALFEALGRVKGSHGTGVRSLTRLLSFPSPQPSPNGSQ
jgi:hypothetical protein